MNFLLIRILDTVTIAHEADKAYRQQLHCTQGGMWMSYRFRGDGPRSMPIAYSREGPILTSTVIESMQIEYRWHIDSMWLMVDVRQVAHRLQLAAKSAMSWRVFCHPGVENLPNSVGIMFLPISGLRIFPIFARSCSINPIGVPCERSHKN